MAVAYGVVTLLALCASVPSGGHWDLYSDRHEAARVGNAARAVIGVIGSFDLQRDVLDAESVAQHRLEVVQHLL